MKKVVRIGRVHLYGDVTASLFCSIELKDGRLSICGVEGPTRDGNCRGACGQIVMHEWDVVEYAPGWDADKVRTFRELWDRWHLNDMKAGSPAQEAYLHDNPVVFKYPESHYGNARDALRAAGLNPDPNYLHNGKPYSYGSAWLRERVPEDALAFLQGLPDTDITPAWV